MPIISIVEDEPEYQKQIGEYLNKYAKDNNLDVTIRYFNDGLAFTQGYLEDNDIIFMDIDMPNMDGFKTAQWLRARNPYVALAFVTCLSKYAIRGYEYDAVDYILKPLRYPSFALKAKKIFDRCKCEQKEKVFITTTDGLQCVSPDSIYSIESLGHKIVYHTSIQDFVTYSTLKNVERDLNDKRFVRCSNCYIVNLNRITSIDKATIMINGKAIAISRKKKKEFLEAFEEYRCNR